MLVDTGRPIDCDLGRGQDLAGRRRQRERSADSVPGASRADTQCARAHARPVHPAEFPVKMLRDVRVAPDGKLVVYSALGHLYTRPLPAGEPKRLTSAGADTYEFFPSFSRDGQWIVYDVERCQPGARPRHQA